MNARPIICTYDGEAFVPLKRFAHNCDKHFVIGERYALVEHHERSTATHNHEFAWLKEAWLQLPEDIAPLYPTPEHLRKRALIQAGYYDEQPIDAGSKAAALRVAAYIRSKDDFALTLVEGPFVLVRTAKSQSRRAMDRKQFAASKSAIMQVIAEMIGVEPEALKREAGMAA